MYKLLPFLLLLSWNLSNGQVKPAEPVKSGTMKVRKTKPVPKVSPAKRKNFKSINNFDM